mmetsp:Transcript_24312/g.91808  ORF Transcript_24312/g.91808 Transcript_24312/m.91808 type:complete len:229 (-) Transcript_24312:678-1364(-)
MSPGLATRPAKSAPKILFDRAGSPVCSTLTRTRGSCSALGGSSSAGRAASSSAARLTSASTLASNASCTAARTAAEPAGMASSSARPSARSAAMALDTAGSCARVTDSVRKGLTQRRRWGTMRKRLCFTSRTPMCLGRASPSMREVATLDPGWLTKKWFPAVGCGTMRESCSWPQITRSMNFGMKSTLMQLFRPRLGSSRFWWISSTFTHDPAFVGRMKRTLSAMKAA